MMNFELTEEHLAVQQAARDFAQTELLPGVIERDEHQKFPAEQLMKIVNLLLYLVFLIAVIQNLIWNTFLLFDKVALCFRLCFPLYKLLFETLFDF